VGEAGRADPEELLGIVFASEHDTLASGLPFSTDRATELPASQYSADPASVYMEDLCELAETVTFLGQLNQKVISTGELPAPIRKAHVISTWRLNVHSVMS